MTKGEALAKVACHMAGLIGAGDIEEATGLLVSEQEAMSAADIARIEWAMDEVQRRLCRMGTGQSDNKGHA